MHIVELDYKFRYDLWPPFFVLRGKLKPMSDVFFVLVTVAFFALSVAYVRGCARLTGVN